MNKLIKTPIKYSDFGAEVVLHYYTEARANNSYDGDDSYHGVQICYAHVEINGRHLKTWYHSNGVKTRKGFAAQRNEFIQQAEKWYGEYQYFAKYPPKAIKCDNIDGRYTTKCPNLAIGDDGRAKCCISPDYWGYGGNLNGNRDVPQDHTCDVYKIMHSGCTFTWDIPGSGLTLLEFWRCYTGEAIRQMKEYRDKQNYCEFIPLEFGL